jgi:hypothetical protein
MSFEEFRQTKPLIFWPSAIVLFVGIVYMVIIGGKTYGSWFENIDLLRTKMAPALNETSGFLMISYTVILCIGNVIMKTSPKYLTGIDTATQEKTTGFVAWLQSRGLSWLPVLVSTTVITLMTFLPIDNKMFKIIIISVVLLATLIAALFFNTLIKLFGPKESFTNVKEEFGHLDNKGNPHDLQITIKVEPSDDKSQPDVIKHEIQADGTPEYPHTSTKGDMKIANDGSGGQGGSWNIPVNTESLTNTVTLIKSASTSNQDVTNKYRIFITDVPFYHPDADTKHNIRELFSKSSFDDEELEQKKYKDLNDSHYKQAGELNITATAATTNLYFHAIKKEKFSEEKTEKGITKYANSSSLVRTGYKASSEKPEDQKFPTVQLNHHQLDLYKVTAKYKQNIKDNKVDYEKAAKLAEQHRETESKELYAFLKNLSGGTSYEKPNDKTTEAYRMVHHIDGQDYTNNGMRISLQNNELFFGFDVKVVKDSVRASYISYYALVWGSFLVYTIVTFIQKKEWTKLLGVVPIPKIPKSLLPFMGAAFVETALIGQSHLSLNESDVASSTGEPSPTFSYAVAGFATRIATVAAFLSNILTQVKD